MKRWVAALGLVVTAASLVRGESRSEAMKAEIARLRSELTKIQGKETGLLGEIARLDADVRLREAEADEATERIVEIDRTIAGRGDRLKSLERAQEQRRRYLGFRMRELYKAGAQGTLATVLGGADTADAIRGLRYAVYLGERDARLLRGWRTDRGKLDSETAALTADRKELANARRDATAAATALMARRRERTDALARIRGDRTRYQSALGELEGASRELGQIVTDAKVEPRRQDVDVRKFRGMLDWPAPGKIAIPFGTAIHPKFKTKVPHPGIDLDVPRGAGFRAIFDGRVAYASTLRGYGLTAIIDHGSGVASVYTHAAMLIVSPGQKVSRGEILGHAGEGGPLGGSGLYFEIRDGGKPVDPVEWLRRR